MKELSKRIFSIAEAAECGVSRAVLANMVERGELERICRGLYAPVGYAGNGHLELEALVRRGCKFVVALESALQLHDFSAVCPHELCIAVPKGARIPAVDLPIKVVHVDRESFEIGAEERDVDGMRVKVYSVARTIADMFKFRGQVGMEVVLNSLKEALARKMFSIDELMRFAAINRVQKVMLPYIEGCLS